MSRSKASVQNEWPALKKNQKGDNAWILLLNAAVFLEFQLFPNGNVNAEKAESGALGP